MTAAEFKNITKKFGSFYANEDISFSIEKNSVHCILGENGAGKTTLMKILFGIYKQDSGKVKVYGEEVHFNSPHDAIDKKIGMVHQHFMHIDDFTVLENIILGNEITKGLKIDFEKTKSILNELIFKYNLGLDVNKKVSDLSISEQQKTEILKLLFRNSEILIFDEPTAVLSPSEVKEFFNITNKFIADGKTVIFITHKLNEVKQISDKVSVLRKGRLVYETENKNGNLDLDKLSNAIVGETVVKGKSQKVKRDTDYANVKPAVSMKNIELVKNKAKVLNGLNLNLLNGEIHGICGVEGNGQNEIADILTGLEMKFSGEFILNGNGISLVPDDRLKKGMIKEFSIGENIILKDKQSNIVTSSITNKISTEVADKYDVRVADINSALGSLSGGNQQKVIFARETELNNDILVFSHPTRGVDINATLFIHSKIIELRNQNKAVLLISSDLDELISLSDKLSVIYNGKIIRTFEESDIRKFTEDKLHLEIDADSNKSLYEEIGKLMIGIVNDDQHEQKN